VIARCDTQPRLAARWEPDYGKPVAGPRAILPCRSRCGRMFLCVIFALAAANGCCLSVVGWWARGDPPRLDGSFPDFLDSHLRLSDVERGGSRFFESCSRLRLGLSFSQWRARLPSGHVGSWTIVGSW
jgi:hypothetical protein